MHTVKQRALSLSAATALALTLAACGSNTAQAGSESSGGEEQDLVLSQDQVTLDGQVLSEGEDGAVTLSHDIVYYQEGQVSDYGEGTAQEEHSAGEADAHLVVTIREAGTYRVSGELTQGQLAVDLGEDAQDDSSAVVTVILDGVDVTCTVAPAFMVYNVYECGSTDVETAAATVDTAAAGINVVLADGSENTFTGSHVARIYEEGTTDKLHKYDGAVYSKMSMNIGGESEGTGVLNIDGDNEGLDSELHLTINGGVINIRAQNDGINTNEDGVSVTTINGGTLQNNAGLGAEGDGIDSNGHLVINGGYVVALGTRNDAVSEDSQQEFMELSFASTLPAGSEIVLADADGNGLLTFTTEKAAQSLTFSSADLKQDVDYTLTVDGVTQEYTGHQSGGFGGAPGGMGGGPGGNMMEIPDGLESWLSSAQDVPDDIRIWLEGLLEMQNSQPDRPDGGTGEAATPPEGQEPPQDNGLSGRGDPGAGGTEAASGEASTLFTLSDGVHSFSGVTDSAQDGTKTSVSFTADLSVGEDGTVFLSNIQASQEVDSSHVQLTITDVPSENYAASCLLSDGDEAIAAILPTDPGTYQLTIAMSGDDSYTGSSQFTFTIPE